MMHRILIGSVLTVVVFAAAPNGEAADPKPKKGPSLSNLSLEVAALQAIHRFEMTTPQLIALRKLAGDIGAKADSRESGKGSEKLRQTLTDLREALIRADDDRIDELEEQWDDLLDEEDYDLDDGVTISTAARRRTGELLTSLTPKQVNAFFNYSSEDLPDPLAALIEALDDAGKASDAEWKDLVEITVEDLGWQLGGLDVDRNRVIGEKVEQYLKKVRSMNAKEFAKQRPEFEKMARQFVSQVPPTVVLHNYAEHALAELLSNPRLAAAVDARLNK